MNLNYIFCMEKKNKVIVDNNIEELFVNTLIDKNITISTAESITGGMVGSTIVNVPGSSDIFHEGYITYSDDVKNKVLNVKKETLKKYTAVSEEVCFEMMVNLKKITGSDSVIVTTGYAGPGENAGLSFIGINLYEKYFIIKLNLAGHRNEIRKKLTNIAINNLYILIKNTN